MILGGHEFDRCPRAILSDCSDVWSIMTSGALADWKLSVSEQRTMNRRYLDAWILMRSELTKMQIDEAKR